jgi:hypothetical protein
VVDADVHSDVDFIVVTREEVNGEQAVALQAMHQRIYALDTPWAQHLEGSYARLRRAAARRGHALALTKQGRSRPAAPGGGSG